MGEKIVNDSYIYVILRDVLAFIGGLGTITFSIKIFSKKIIFNQKMVNKKIDNNGVINSGDNFSYQPGISLPQVQGFMIEAVKKAYEEAQKTYDLTNHENINKIFQKALIDIKSVQTIDQDWFNRFYEYASKVSTDEMQTIWAKILSGELDKQGSYSLKTLDNLRNIQKEHAQLITKFSSYVFYEDSILNDRSIIDFPDFLKLVDIGFLMSQEFLKLNIDVYANDRMGFHFFGKFLLLIINNTTTSIKISLPVYKLTQFGNELLSIINPNPEIEYVKVVADKIKSLDNKLVTSIYKINYIEADNINYENDPLYSK